MFFVSDLKFTAGLGGNEPSLLAESQKASNKAEKG